MPRFPDGHRPGPARRTPLLTPGRRQAVDLELQHHLEERVERLIEEGWAPDDARREAERRFGGLAKYRRRTLAETTTGMGRRGTMTGFDGWMQDVAFALRSVARQRGFAATVIATLALGIGATGGVFSVLDAVLLRPLPFAEPDRLVSIEQRDVEADVILWSVPTAQLDAWRTGAGFLSASASYDRVDLVRTDRGEADQVAALAATHDLDEVLGIGPALGRLLAADDVAEERRVVVLGWPYWMRTGADPDVVGSTLRLDDETWTVVGVLPRGVKFPVTSRTDLWIPMGDDGSILGAPRARTRVVGRLADGLTLAAAQERADAVASSLAEADPAQGRWGARVSPVGAWRANADTARGLWMVAGAAVAMLLIALVNGTNLLLVRGQARLGEIGIRKALGASRGRVVRQVLLESLVLALAAGVAATGVAWAGVEAVAAIAPREVTFGMVHEFGLEPRALAVVFLVAVTSGLLVGLIPGLGLARTRAAGSGSAGARTRDRGAARLRSALVVGEVALSVMLLVGAGLLVRSFSEILRVDLGMATEELAFLTVDLPENRYPDGPARADFVDRMLQRLDAVPGVRSASVASGGPPEGGGIFFSSALQGEGRDPLEGTTLVPFAETGPGYLETLGTTLSAGRDFQPSDVGTDAAIIDAGLARRLFGEESVAGRRFTLDADAEEVQWHTVVGVVDHLVLGGADGRAGEGALLAPLDPDAPSSYLVFSVRAEGDPGALLPELRAVLGSVDDLLPVVGLRTGARAVGESLARPRFVVLLMTVAAALALLLAAIGIYGVVAYTVRRQRREMGIRIALGAPAGTVGGLVLRWGLGMALLGSALGLVGAGLLDHLAAALLFGVNPGDPGTRVAVVALMIGVTGAACALPARRATRVDPVEVLKGD